jgi:hypothetical protein
VLALLPCLRSRSAFSSVFFSGMMQIPFDFDRLKGGGPRREPTRRSLGSAHPSDLARAETCTDRSRYSASAYIRPFPATWPVGSVRSVTRYSLAFVAPCDTVSVANTSWIAGSHSIGKRSGSMIDDRLQTRAANRVRYRESSRGPREVFLG